MTINVFASIDYSSIELATLAQYQLIRFGKSTLAEVLNARKDIHIWVGAPLIGTTYEDLMQRYMGGEAYAAAVRQSAKAFNYGVWGGMGAARIVSTYGGKAMVAIAEDQDKRYLANGELDHEATAIAVAGRLKKIVVDAFPEGRMLLTEVARKTRDDRLFTWRDPTSQRTRGKLGYCDGNNTPFQGRAADGGKEAAWLLSKACYTDRNSVLWGVRPWMFVHDEFLLEGPRETAHEWAWEASRLMIEGMKKYVPDVFFEAEPAIMRRWYKGAQLLLDDDGRLAPWEPWRKTNSDDPTGWQAHDWVLDHVHGRQAFANGELTYKKRLTGELYLGLAA